MNCLLLVLSWWSLTWNRIAKKNGSELKMVVHRAGKERAAELPFTTVQMKVALRTGSA